MGDTRTSATTQTWKETVQLMLGACPANIDKDDLIASVKEAQEKIDLVLQGGELLNGYQKNGGSIAKLKSANGKLGEFLEALDKVDTICKDIKALNDIHDAMANISPDDFRNDPKKAAKAFDKFFVGLARFCRFAEILKPYGQFFESFTGFFETFADLRLRKEAEVYTDKPGGRNYAGQ